MPELIYEYIAIDAYGPIPGTEALTRDDARETALEQGYDLIEIGRRPLVDWEPVP